MVNHTICRVLGISILSNKVKSSQVLPRSEWLARVKLNNICHLLAFGFGSGLAKWMPGTFGSAAAIPFVILLSFLPLWLAILVTVISCIVGIAICQRAADDLQVHDHPAIVWDEFAGMFITFLAVPLTWQNLVLGFVLFRLFDILKPWPIGWADKQVSEGLGIMLDDIIAGLFALTILQIGLYFSLI